jgi:hypothetical protein
MGVRRVDLADLASANARQLVETNIVRFSNAFGLYGMLSLDLEGFINRPEPGNGAFGSGSQRERPLTRRNCLLASIIPTATPAKGYFAARPAGRRTRRCGGRNRGDAGRSRRRRRRRQCVRPKQ